MVAAFENPYKSPGILKFSLLLYYYLSTYFELPIFFRQQQIQLILVVDILQEDPPDISFVSLSDWIHKICC